MKKTFYYNFLPTKAEEEIAKANNNTQLSKVLIEIREIHPHQPLVEYLVISPWRIKKTLTDVEIVTGKLKLRPEEVCEHVFRYWALDMINNVVKGLAQPVTIWDVSDEGKPNRYVDEYCFFEKGPNGRAFVIGLKDVIRDRCVHSSDEVGLFWHSQTASFHFKILRRDD